ncbi:MAG: DUF389 domain-containing protein [Chloroflexi bacterium]|nr:DUF389 domain-containing protein [Chloroflexota bacterium]
MPRTVQVALPPERTEAVLNRLRGTDGVVGLALQRGTSLDPPGDILTVQATTDGARAVLRALADLKGTDGWSVLTSEPISLLAPPYQNHLEEESNEAILEEMAFLLRKETNLNVNYFSLMAISGAIAAVGLWTDTLHIVIAAMVVAPGFEPLLRVPLGLITGPRVLALRGLLSTLTGYLALALGALLTLFLLRAIDPGGATDLAARQWVTYWSRVTGTSVLLAVVAGMAGAFTVAAQRSVLTAGVMIALALIPGMAIAAMAVGMGDFGLAAEGLGRWVVDAAAVVIAGAAVLGAKQAIVHRRAALG